MASVGYVANSLVSTESVNLQEVLTNFGHTVSTSDQASFGSGTFSGQDVVVVGPTDRDDGSFVANLDAHMDTHGVPVIVAASGGLSAGEIGRNVSDVPDTTASALGLIALERRPGSATPADGMRTRDESKESMITDGFTAGPALEDELMLSEGAGGADTEVPESVVSGVVREVVSNVAGRRLLNNDQGFTLACAADSGDPKVGARTGETFATRAAWFGLAGTERVGKDAAAVVEGMIQWVLGGTVDDFPTAGTQGAVLARVDLRALDTYESGSVSWSETTPAGTSVTVEVSDDDGASWSAQPNGGAIAVLSNGEDVSNKALLIRITLATTDSGETPTFGGLDVVIRGQNPALRDDSDVIRPTGFFDGGLVIWLTGANSGRAMEIRTWDASTRTITLFLPMPDDVAVGDEFDIRPGCLKRLLEDCRDKFDNVVNFRGEPYVPGTDAVTGSFPDAQG